MSVSRCQHPVGVNSIDGRRFIQKRSGLFCSCCVVSQNLHVECSFVQIRFDDPLQITNAVQIVRVRVGERRNDETVFQINRFVNFCWTPNDENPINGVKCFSLETRAVEPVAVYKFVIFRLLLRCRRNAKN